MSPLKRISVFFILCSLIYALLVAPWPGLLDGYRVCFRWGGSTLFQWFGDSGSVSFKALSSGDHVRDTTMVLTKLRPFRVRGSMDIKSVYTGYRPTIFLIALVLATPLPLGRRCWALFWGLVWVNVFVGFRLMLRIVDAFSADNALAIFSFPSYVKIPLGALTKIMVLAPEMHYIVPAFIWIMVCFRGGEWRSLFGFDPLASGAGAPKKCRSNA